MEKTELPEYFYLNMDFAVLKHQKHLFIQDLNQIGWPDPLINDVQMQNPFKWRQPEKISDFVFSKKCYVYKKTPHMIYIPSKETMFKIMRACIDITDIQ